MTKKAVSHCIAIAGDFTIVNAAAVREQLLAAVDSTEDIEVDLSDVTEIDSAGLQLMIAAKRHVADKKKSLRFIGHSAAVLDALDLIDLAAHFGDPVLLHSRA